LAWENQKKSVVCVCIPHTSNISFEWAQKTYVPLQVADARFDKVFQMSRGVPVDNAREEMVNNALKQNATHIFFVDSDIILEPPLTPNDAIAMLLNLNQPIVSGLYRAKQAKNPGQTGGDPAAKFGFNYAIWQRIEGSGFVPVLPPPPPTNLFTVDVTGLGLTLIKREVFEKVGKPWFPWENGGPSEDFAFYMKAKELGYLCWVFSAVTASHAGDLKVKIDGSFSTLEV
jgi:GT2 family glycosyltransferase